GEDTPARVIAEIRPAVLVKGADYRANEIVGADTVRAAGGRVVRVPLLAGRSTTNIVRNARAAARARVKARTRRAGRDRRRWTGASAHCSICRAGIGRSQNCCAGSTRPTGA